MLLFINILIFLLALASTIVLYKIWRVVKGKGRLVLLSAFAYLVILRGAYVLSNIIHIPAVMYPQESLPFYILATAGFCIFWHEIKDIMSKK